MGAVAVDLMCQLIPELFHAGDSNPGTSSSSIGGVALNVATAAKYAGANVKLISQIGKDSFGKFVVAQLKAKGIATSGISESSTHNTAKYVSVHENSGDLIVACAEMDIAEHFDTSVISELEATRPKVVVADSNVSAQILAEIITKAAELDAAVVYEPTSSVKAERIAEAILIEPANFTQHLSHFFSGSRPSGLVLATPTASELTTIHDALESRGLFDVDVWFPVLDSLGINSQFRNQLDSLGLPVFKYAIKEGILQKAFKLLPYIPSLVIKLGDKGLFVVNISVITNQLVRRTKASRDSALSSGPLIDGIRLGVCVEYFKIPKSIRIKNVTGAGDTLVGVLAQETLRHGTDWLFNSGDRRTKILQRAQLAAGESLQSQESVSINIKNI